MIRSQHKRARCIQRNGTSGQRSWYAAPTAPGASVCGCQTLNGKFKLVLQVKLHENGFEYGHTKLWNKFTFNWILPAMSNGFFFWRSLLSPLVLPVLIRFAIFILFRSFPRTFSSHFSAVCLCVCVCAAAIARKCLSECFEILHLRLFNSRRALDIVSVCGPSCCAFSRAKHFGLHSSSGPNDARNGAWLRASDAVRIRLAARQTESIASAQWNQSYIFDGKFFARKSIMQNEIIWKHCRSVLLLRATSASRVVVRCGRKVQADETRHGYYSSDRAGLMNIIYFASSKQNAKVSTTNTVNQERPKQASPLPNGSLFWSLRTKAFALAKAERHKFRMENSIVRLRDNYIYKLQLCHRKFRCIDERRRIDLASSSTASRNEVPPEAAHQNGLEFNQFTQFMRHQIGRMLSQPKMQTRDFIRNNGILIGSWYQRRHFAFRAIFAGVACAAPLVPRHLICISVIVINAIIL